MTKFTSRLDTTAWTFGTSSCFAAQMRGPCDDIPNLQAVRRRSERQRMIKHTILAFMLSGIFVTLLGATVLVAP